MITVPDFVTEPVKKHLEVDPDVYVVVRPATLMDESRRLEYGFHNQPTAPVMDVMLAEVWVTLEECNIQRENGEPLLVSGMPFDEFCLAATALWDFNPQVLVEMQQAVREVNPKWGESDADPT